MILERNDANPELIVAAETYRAAMNAYINALLLYSRPIFAQFADDRYDARDMAVLAAFMLAALPDADAQFALTLHPGFVRMNLSNMEAQGVTDYDGPVFYYPDGPTPSEKPSFEHYLLLLSPTLSTTS